MSKAPPAIGPSRAKNRARGTQAGDTLAPAALHRRISSACSTGRGALSQTVSKVKAGLAAARIALASASEGPGSAACEEADSSGGDRPGADRAAPHAAAF